MGALIELRELTERGIQRFESYLRDLDNSKESIPKPDLNVEPFSNTLELKEKIYIDEKKTFKSRLDIGNYLQQKLSLVGVGRENVITEKQEQWMNVWTWLAYVWVNQFVPVRNGVHVVPAISRFIGSSDWRRFYRHFVSTPYYIFSLHKSQKSKLFLECPPTVHNEFMEQIGSRQWIITSTQLVELAYTLYWNREENRSKRGASGKGKGTVRRFGKVMNQFMLTYDIHQMNIEEILDLLPSEFNEWK